LFSKLTESRRCWEGGSLDVTEWTSEGERKRRMPEYGRRSRALR